MSPRPITRLGSASFLLATSLAACTDPETPLPTSQPPNLSAETQAAADSMFYYYEGRRIGLEPTGDAVVIDSDDPDPRGTVESNLGANSVSVGQVGKLGSLASHWIVPLSTTDATVQARAAAILRSLNGIRFAEPTYRLSGTRTTFIPTNRVTVLFKSSTTRTQIDSLAASLGLQLIRPPYPDSGFFEYAFRYPPSTSLRPLAIAALLDRHPLAQWADPVRVSNLRRAFVPSDPLYSYQYHLKNSVYYNGTRVDINAEPAWDITKGSSSIKVAIVDDGVENLHPDMIWSFNGGLGYDLVGVPGQPDNAFNPYLNDTHGNSVAGIVFGAHNTEGVAGIAPNTIARSVRIFRGNDPPATSDEVAQGLNWAWQSAASDVIVNAWTGGAQSQQLELTRFRGHLTLVGERSPDAEATQVVSS